MLDKAELDMGDDPPSLCLVEQGVSTRPRVAAGLTLEMCLQQRLQRLLILKRNTSEITTTA